MLTCPSSVVASTEISDKTALADFLLPERGQRTTGEWRTRTVGKRMERWNNEGQGMVVGC